MKVRWPWVLVGKPEELLIEQLRRVFGDLEPKYHVTQPADNRKQYHVVERWKREKPAS